MATLLFALPIKPGQTQAARAFAQECLGPRYADYDASEQRIGIPVENWYLQSNAAGQFFTIQVEGPDLMSSLGAFISSRDPFDLWFKEQLAAITGIDLMVPRLVDYVYKALQLKLLIAEEFPEAEK